MELLITAFAHKDSQKNDQYVLHVPDLDGRSFTHAKSIRELLRKGGKNIKEQYSEKELLDTNFHPLEYFSSKQRRQKIPKNAIPLTLSINIGGRIKKHKRFTSSMDIELLNEIEKYSKKHGLKKSDFFAMASRKLLES
jgi:predicted RNase H-like HicB family nuclease